MNAETLLSEASSSDETRASVSAPAPRIFRLSSWLRALGAASFVGAGASFLVEGWTDPGVLKRQVLWALGTLILTICGIVAIRRYRDATSARVFLGLAAATIPAHFAQVGASLWALRFEGIGTLAEVLVAGGILVALAAPLALGVSALVRKHARLLVALMFATGCPLLLPIRDGDVIALFAVLEIALCLTMEATIFRRSALFRSVEGICARMLLFVPCLILLVRNAFYPSTDLWLSALVGVPSLALLALPRLWSRTDRSSFVGQVSGALGLCAAGVIAVPHAPTLGLLLSSVVLVASEIVGGRPLSFAWGAAGLLAAAGVASFIEPNAFSIVLAASIGALHAVAAFRRRSLPLTITASAISLISVLAHALKLVRLPTHDVWLVALALSVGFLGLAALVEQRRDRIQRRFSQLQNHFAAKQ